MIKVEILTRNNQIVGFTASGHAGYGAYGEDIVCSGVSAITQTALLGIVELIKAEASYDIDDDGYVECMLTEQDEAKRSQAQLIFEVMELGLCNIEMNYKKNLKVSHKEL